MIMNNNTSSTNRAKSAPSHRGDSNSNSSSTSVIINNQTRPLSSTTIDSKNVINNMTNTNTTNADEYVDVDNNDTVNYNPIENNTLGSIKPRPLSNHTVASLDESSTSTDVNWLLDTFDNNIITRTATTNKLMGPNGSIYDASMSIHGDSTSLEFLDRPGSNIQQSFSLLPSTTSQKLLSSSNVKRPVTSDASSPMIRALLVSPYTKHRRTKTASENLKKTKTPEDFLRFVKPNKPSWSVDPFPSSGLFTEVQKQQDSRKEREKFTSKLVKSWNEDTLRIAKRTNASLQNNDNPISFNANMSSVNITSLSLPIIDKQNFYSLSETGNENIPTKELFDPSEPDPLYRIIREESERDVDIEKLSKLVNKGGPIVANPGARRAEAELAAINPLMMKHDELIALSQYETLPANLWVIARVVYLLFVNYSELLTDENSILMIQPQSPSMIDSNKKTRKSKKDAFDVDIDDMADQEYMTWLLSDSIKMENFWAIVKTQRTEYGISSLNALQKFSWSLLKELFMRPLECAVALFCLEKGGYNLEKSVFGADINERLSIRDFYSMYPEEFIPTLRAATKPHSFHPNIVAMVSLPAARLCSWARRVVAGIVKVKQASTRYSIENDAPNLEFDEDSFTEYNNDKGKSRLKLSSDTNRKQFEQKVSYPLKQSTYFNVISMTDGGASLHAAYVAGLSISRPLDRYDVIIVGKNNPNELKSNYEEMTQLISNSPTHRIMTHRDLINNDNNNNNDDENNNIASFAKAAASHKNNASQIILDRTDRTISMDMIDIITHSIIHEYDICSIALNSPLTNDPKKVDDFRKLFSNPIYQNRAKPFLLVLANRQKPTSLPSLMTVSSISGYTFAPSRYVIFVNNSYESKLAVSMIQALAKPCDLIFLVHILIHTLKTDGHDNSMIEDSNYRSSFIANELLLEYRTKGYNLHVEPVHIPHPSNTKDTKRLQYIATQMRHVASVFEPTYIVMDAIIDDITLMVSKKIVNRNIRSSGNGNNNGNDNNIIIASSLEDDDNIYIPNDTATTNTDDNNNKTLISTMLETEKQIVLSDRTISFILVLTSSNC